MMPKLLLEDYLFHWETLFVYSSSHFEDVAFELLDCTEPH